MPVTQQVWGEGGGEGEREETRFMGRKGKGENGTLKKNTKKNKYDDF